MGIAADLKEVFEEVGISYKILRDSGDVSGEFLDFEPNEQITKPFIREYFLEVSLASDTEAIGGDVVEFLPSGETGDKYLLMNKTADIFENEIIKYDGVLYKVNVSGEILRSSGEVWDDNYRKGYGFKVVKTTAYGLQVEPLFGGELEDNTDLALIGLEKHELYVPSSYGIQELDQYISNSGEYYRVESIKARRYKGVDVIILGEDTR